MIKRLTLVLLLSAYLAPLIGGNRIAISYFDNTSEQTKYNVLSKGIADMLITDLSKVDGIQIVEREKLEFLIEEIKLGETKYFDQSTAQKLGKGLGADAILTGAFLIVGDQIRIDARLIDVESSNIILAEQVSGNTKNFFQLQAKLVQLLGTTLKLPKQQTQSITSMYQTVSLQSVVKYSEAIDNFDSGLEHEALEELRELTDEHPEFLQAQNKLDAIRESIEKSSQVRDEMLKQEVERIFSNINPESEDYTAVANAWSTLSSSLRYSALVEFNNQLKEKGIKLDAKPYGEYYPITLGELMEYYNIMAYTQLQMHDRVIVEGEKFLKKYPLSQYFSAIKIWVGQSLEEIDAREKGAKLIDETVELEQFYAYAYFMNRFEVRYVHKFCTEKDKQRFYSLATKEIIPYVYKVGKLWEDYEVDELEDMMEPALIFGYYDLAEELIEVAKKTVPNNSYDTETPFDMEEEYRDFLKDQEEKTEKLASIKQRINESGTELYTAAGYASQLIRADAYEEAIRLCKEYLASDDPRLGDPKKEDQVGRSIRYAWDNLFDCYEKLGLIKEFEDLLDDYNDDEFMQERYADHHEDYIRDFEEDLRDLKNEYKTYLKDIVHFPLERNLLIAEAKAYMQNKQYIAEIKARTKLLKKYQMEEEAESYEYYYLFNAYRQLGKFDAARQVISLMKQRFPESSMTHSAAAFEMTMPY